MESVAQLTVDPIRDLVPSTPLSARFADFCDLAAGHAQPPVRLDPEHAVRRYLQPSIGSLRPLFSLRNHGAISFVPTAPVLANRSISAFAVSNASRIS
jgi:hypothetical protein